jgi:hypothetical protein
MSLRCIKLQTKTTDKSLFCSYCDFNTYSHQIVWITHNKNKIYISNADTGMFIRTLEQPNCSFSLVAFNHDGTMIASVCNNNNVIVWNANTGTIISTLQNMHGPEAGSVAFNPDSTMIVAGFDDSTVCIWDVNSGTLVRTLQGHNWEVGSVSFSPDGTRIVSGSLDSTVRIWDVSEGTLINTIQGHTDLVRSVAFSPDGTKIVSGAYNKMICVWDVNTATLINTFQGNDGSVAFSPNGTKIIEWSPDGNTISIWKTTSGLLINNFVVRSIPLMVKFNEDETQIYVVDTVRNVCTYYVQSKEDLTSTQTLADVMLSRDYRDPNPDKIRTSADGAALFMSNKINTDLISEMMYGNTGLDRRAHLQNYTTPYRNEDGKVDFEFHRKKLQDDERKTREFNESRARSNELYPPEYGTDDYYNPQNSKAAKSWWPFKGGKKNKKTRKYKKNKSKKYKKNKL